MIIGNKLFRKVLATVLAVALLLALNVQLVVIHGDNWGCLWYDDYGHCLIWSKPEDNDPIPIPTYIINPIPTYISLPITVTPSGG